MNFMTIKYKLKSWPEFFTEIFEGRKKHDMRKCDDRDFKVGDILLLQEYDGDSKIYTGREVEVEVTYITSEKTPCAWSPTALKQDFCILSIKLLVKKSKRSDAV